MKTLILIATFLTQTAFAANIVRVDAKKALGLNEGDYVVTQADSAIEKENLCVKGSVHTVKWGGNDADPVLSIGAARVYVDFNAGLVKDEPSYSKHRCVYSHSTQALKNRLIEDDFANCDDENTTSHTELSIKGDTVVYTKDMKASRNGKVISIPSKCTLKKVSAQKFED
jgi:hypothetical protein